MTTFDTISQPGIYQPSAWVETLLRDSSAEPQFAMHSFTVEGAAQMKVAELESAVQSAYLELLETGVSLGMQPFRIWNFIPGILQPLGELRHRYMAFNAGRHLAYEEVFDTSSERIPVASGTGKAGSDLLVHCLYAADPGGPVENPRQISAYHYSEQWGPRPPSFARARCIDAPAWDEADRLLVVAGTASIVGEETLHGANLDAQLEEIEANLDALAQAAGAGSGRSCPMFRDIRVYVPCAVDLEAIEHDVARRFDGTGSIEFVESELCRPGLRVEIEGLLGFSR